ncbi:MAG: DUF3802 family protein [Gammaproteobacteria bacterium]|nr:DUF3802 family protein [Gammaproteobacteria bacterium]
MITRSDGYVALIEYLTENLSLFETRSESDSNAPTVKLFIKYQMTEQLVVLFIQHKNLLPEEKMYLIGEFETATQDLLEILGRNLKHQIDDSQKSFIIEFVSLLKNLFDSLLLESIN